MTYHAVQDLTLIGRREAMTNAAAMGSWASALKGKVTVTMTANVPVVWSVALTIAPGEMGTTAVREVALI